MTNRVCERWKESRVEALRERSWLVLAVWLAYAVVFVRAAGRSPDWAVAILGVGGVFMFLEITAYYYSILLAFALLHERDLMAGPAICAFSAISLLLASYWASAGLALVHVGMSVLLVPLILVSTWRAGRPMAGEWVSTRKGT